MKVLTDPQGWFRLAVPDGWEGETEDCVTTLKSPAGVGVVFICGGRHARGRQRSFGRADFLARFLRSLGISVGTESINGREGEGCRIYSFTRDADGAHWRYWSVTDDETALLISYTCSVDDVEVEEHEVEDMIDSVQLFHSPAVH